MDEEVESGSFLSDSLVLEHQEDQNLSSVHMLVNNGKRVDHGQDIIGVEIDPLELFELDGLIKIEPANLFNILPVIRVEIGAVELPSNHSVSRRFDFFVENRKQFIPEVLHFPREDGQDVVAAGVDLSLCLLLLVA